ncbi:hypothetical protein [Anaplasma phagocytophilum]|uniref:hypothetical protein n=1 Tax=Anaplasma phagocytophilum TaxID=948 RepID=UPI000B1CAA8F|nr:hypothetical protein [Anaplasma phagocytophilum]
MERIHSSCTYHEIKVRQFFDATFEKQLIQISIDSSDTGFSYQNLMLLIVVRGMG